MAVSLNPASAQKKEVKIFVNTDLEWISGVYKFAQTREKDTPLNIQACEYFMGDLAAVIHGLRDGGATQVVVLTAATGCNSAFNGSRGNLSYRPAQKRTHADSTFAGMCQIGFHARTARRTGYCITAVVEN
jgi:D-aminopeptidase